MSKLLYRIEKQAKYCIVSFSLMLTLTIVNARDTILEE